MFSCPISCWVVGSQGWLALLLLPHSASSTGPLYFSRKPHWQPCAAVKPLLGTLFPGRGLVHCFSAACNANEVRCPGAPNVPSYTTRTGLNIPQPFLFHFRDLVTEESLNQLIVIRACIFGSFPLLPDQLYCFCQATPSFPQLNALQGWAWDSLSQLWKMDPWISYHRCNEFYKIIFSFWIVFMTSRAKFTV